MESQYDFEPEANSSFHYEYDWPEVSSEFVGIHGFDDDGFQLKAISFAEEFLVVALKVDVQADIDCSFDFSVHDSIDKDYVSMGSGTSSEAIDLVVDILVTLGGTMPECDVIEDIEIIKKSVVVDFGSIEPDWMDHPEEDMF